MAQKLRFSGIQPVEFCGRDCKPRTLTTGDRLRLQEIDWKTEDDAREADEILAGCFEEDDQAFVLDFLSQHMTPTDKNILKSYLLEGEKAIAMLDSYSDKMAEKALDKMTADAVNGMIHKMKEAKK